jgi:hypothetical protein
MVVDADAFFPSYSILSFQAYPTFTLGLERINQVNNLHLGRAQGFQTKVGIEDLVRNKNCIPYAKAVEVASILGKFSKFPIEDIVVKANGVKAFPMALKIG